MKRNMFLRTAGYLMLAAVLTTSLFCGTWTKYATTAASTAGARVAKFSFVANTNRNIASSSPDYPVYPTGYAEIAVDPTTPTTFTVPLFDKQYYSPVPGGGWFQGPASSVITVDSRDVVVAPGTGVNFGPGAHGDSYCKFLFKNDSEVAVRYRLSLDEDKSELHGLSIYLYLDKAGAWVPAAGSVLSGDASSEWTDLEPDSAISAITLGYFWVYSEDGYEGYGGYGNGVKDFMAGLTLSYDDVRDSRLGMQAADYLRATGVLSGNNQSGSVPSEGDVTVKLVFKLEVQQID